MSKAGPKVSYVFHLYVFRPIGATTIPFVHAFKVQEKLRWQGNRKWSKGMSCYLMYKDLRLDFLD